jgi:peptide/nickel transport system permease protein
MGMWGYAGRQAGRFVLGIAGAFLLAAAVAALSDPGARSGVSHYLRAFFGRIDQVAHLTFGSSAMTSAPAVAEIARGLPITFELIGAGLIMALVVGIPVGLLFGIWRLFRPVAPLIQIVTAIPVFCAAMLALWLAHYFGMKTSTLSNAGFLAAGPQGLVPALRAIALPALITGASAAAAIQLSLQRTVAEAIAEPFYENMKRMGLSVFEIDRAYLAPYVLIGFFHGLADIALSLFAADAVVEWMFDWPGAATLFIRSVALHDWNVAALVLLVFASVVLAADFAGRLGARAIAGAAS